MVSNHQRLGGARVLVVDDCDDLGCLLCDALRSSGAHVSSADSGRAAMVMLQAGSFDLVLLDVVMPEIDGLSVLRFCRRIDPTLPARTILLTGDRYHFQWARGRDLGAAAVVYKPFDLDEVRSVACDVLAGATQKHV